MDSRATQHEYANARGPRARVRALLLCALACLSAFGCSDCEDHEHGAGGPGTNAADQDGGIPPGESGSGGRASGGSGGRDAVSNAGAGAGAGGTGVASCVPTGVDEVPDLTPTPSRAVDRAIDIADVGGRYGGLVADGVGGVWVLAAEGMPPASSPTGAVALLHYAADGQLRSKQSLRGAASSLAALLIAGNEPRLVGTYEQSAQLGTTMVGDGSAPGLFIARLSDDGLELEAQLNLAPAPTAPNDYYRIEAGARDSSGRVLLGVMGNTRAPQLGCDGQPALLGFDGAAVAMRSCISTSQGVNALVPDGAGGAYVSTQDAIERVDGTGAHAWRFATTFSVIGLAALDDGVAASGVNAGSDYASSPALLALHGDGTPAWERRFSARGTAYARTLVRLQDGSLLVAGTFDDALQVGDGTLLAENPRASMGGYEDAFVLHTDAQGMPLSAERAGSALSDQAHALAAGMPGEAWLFLLTGGTSDYRTSLLHLALDAARLPPALDTSGDPYTRIAAPEGFADQDFGRSIAVDGDLAVIGRTLHVLTRQGDSFAVGAQLQRPDDATSSFAESLALSEHALVVADPAIGFDDNPGRVYVYARVGERFSFEARLQPAETPDDKDDFGRAIALIGETLFVASQRGVHVFEHAGGRWLERDMLAGPTGRRGYYSANAEVLASDGERLFVGMPGERIERPADGAVYVYARSGDAFAFERVIEASDPLPFAKNSLSHCTGTLECGEMNGRGFGAGIAVDAQRVIIGADHGERPDGERSPELYLFERDGAGYRELGKQRVSYVGNRDWRFRRSMPLALLGERLALGSPSRSVRGAAYAGSAELLPLTPRSDGAVTTGVELRSIDPTAGARLGTAIARSRDDLLIGAPGEHGGQVLIARLRCER